MNAAQVNQEWWKQRQAERSSRCSMAALRDERRKMVDWCREACPELCDVKGNPCPYLLDAVGRLWHLRGSGTVTKTRIVDARNALLRRSFRGDDAEIAEYEALFGSEVPA